MRRVEISFLVDKQPEQAESEVRKVITGIFAESKPIKIQHDKKNSSCSHNDDFHTWYLFFQELCHRC